LIGLVLMMLSLAMAILLILDGTLGTTGAMWITGGILCWFSMWWYVLPMRYRMHATRASHHRKRRF
jgi:hypothetical protein